ncbi:MAG: hypothetical protein OHK0019_09930 [Saprospiraceae bacterium]
MTMRAQLVYTDIYGFTYTISSDIGGVCDAPNGASFPVFSYDNPALQTTFNQVSPSQYFKAKFGEPVTITVEVRNPSGIPSFSVAPFKALIGTDSPPYLYDLDNIEGSGLENEYNQNNQLVAYRYSHTFYFGRADTKGWIIIRNVSWFESSRYFILPFVVEGLLTSEVPILGTTVQPQLPYFILHAPPGDGSTAEFQESKTVCREMVQSAATDNSNSGYVDVKVGVAGSVGFIATVNYEFSVTVGASAGGGEMNIKTQGNQTCLTVTEGFQTPPGGEDVFVGYGTDLAYGVTSEVRIDSSCQAYLHPVGLAYMPIGQPRQFYYTKSEILDQIAQQQLFVDDTTLSVRARNDAQNQVDVWNRVLVLNEANINNPSNVQIGSVSYGTVPSSQESSITVTETASIEYEQYVDYSASLDVVVEVGGSGVSGGYEYRGSQRYGKIENQSQELTKIVRYSLSDDDPGDLFNVNVFRDPMFGTPIFRSAAGTKSSCPYQGGYQRDQPKLKHDGTADDHITLLGNPVGSSATFKIDLCNESNEVRSYNLKLNAESNLNGAVVSAAGVPLNGNDLGQSFTVPANSCIQDLVVEVKQLSVNSPLTYPNLELFLYSPCEESIQSNVFASVYFGNATSTDETQEVLSRLALSPNPASDAVYLDFDMQEPAPVRLELWDMQGLEVKTESLGVVLAGQHRQLLELGDLPNGIYLLTLQSQGSRMYRKVVVQR